MNKADIRKVISQSILADGMSPIIDLNKSHGSWLVDKVSGKIILKFIIKSPDEFIPSPIILFFVFGVIISLVFTNNFLLSK